MLPVARIACQAWNSSASAVTGFRRITGAVPRLVGMILAYPACALADSALGVHDFIVPPAVFPAHAMLVLMIQLADWQTLFAVQAGAAATLTGLGFVAVSINLPRIIETPGPPGRAV